MRLFGESPASVISDYYVSIGSCFVSGASAGSVALSDCAVTFLTDAFLEGSAVVDASTTRLLLAIKDPGPGDSLAMDLALISLLFRSDYLGY